MLLQPINIVYHKNASITIVLGAMVMLLLFSSCSGKKKELGDAITERDSMAVMDTRGVTTLVSDSGVTRYRINTEEWLVFDRKNHYLIQTYRRNEIERVHIRNDMFVLQSD